MFKFERKDVLGLDIGSSQVKLVQLRKNHTGYAVTAAAVSEIRPGTADDTNKDDAVTNAIRQCLSSSRVQTNFAVCGVSGPEVAVRSFSFPPMPTGELAAAVDLEATQVCPFSIDESAVDYQLIEEDEQCMRGVLVAATNKLLSRKTGMVKNASLKCVLVDVEGLALLNCLEVFSPEQNNSLHGSRTVAALNVCNTQTTLAIKGDNGLPFIRDISYAGNHILKYIADHHNMDIEEVRNILCCCTPDAQADPAMEQTLSDSLHRLVIDVNETLRYYAAQERSTSVDRVLVCGGFALVKNFVELLNEQLTAEAVLWNPLQNVTCKTKYVSQEIIARNGPAMALAAGLAVRSI